MLDESEEMRDRLRASEVLGRSEGDFFDRHDARAEQGVIFKIDLTPPPRPEPEGAIWPGQGQSEEVEE